MQNESINEQTINNEIPPVNKTNQFDLKTFIINNKKILLIVLGVVLVLELIWATSFISGSKKTTPATSQTPITTQAVSLPKGKIASLVLEPATVSVKAGEPVTLKINVDTNGRTVNGIDALLTYDPQFLEAVTPVANGDLFNSLLINNVDQENGKITLTGSRISQSSNPVTGKGTFAVVTFTPIKSGNTEVKFVFDPTKTNTSNVTETKASNNILTTTNNATIQITP